MATCKSCGKPLILNGGKCAYCGADPTGASRPNVGKQDGKCSHCNTSPRGQTLGQNNNEPEPLPTCPKCGKHLPAGAKFCPNCGASLLGQNTHIDLPLRVEYGNVFCTMRDFVGVMDIPPYIDGQRVTAIGKMAFCVCQGIESITIPNTVSLIGAEAFEGCWFTKIVIPDSVLSIGKKAFDSSRLSGIRLSKSLESISDECFRYCFDLTSINIPNNVTSIGYNAFEKCSLTEIVIPESVKIIKSRAFRFCRHLSNIEIPPTVDEIERAAFEGVFDVGKRMTGIIPRKFCTQNKILDIFSASSPKNYGFGQNTFKFKDEYGTDIIVEELPWN